MAKSSITVRILGDAKGIQDALGKAESAVSGFSARVAGVGKAAATAVAVGGGALLALGTRFDDAKDTIIVGTGASGAALDGLMGDFRAVAASVPSGLGDVGTAIADINTRLDLSGKPLQDMAGRMLNLSRITKTDLSTNIANITRVFGDAGVAAEDQAKGLDAIFEATKRTGISLDRLTTLTVNYGAPMRQLGFSFDESLAILGKWEKEGVNIETVMGGMRQGLGKLARAGEEPAQAFQRIVDEIANAGSAGEANKLALEAFGQRAGPDMAAAIREGRFEIGDMVAALENSGGALDDAVTRTNDWRQSLGILKNKALLKLGPVADKAFQAVTRGVEMASPYLEAFAGWLGDRIPPIATAIRDWMVRNWPKIRDAIASVVDWLTGTAWPAVKGFVDQVVAGFQAVVAWFQQNWPYVVGGLAGFAAAVLTVAVPAFVAWAGAALAAAAATIAAAAPFVALGAAFVALGAGVVYAYQHFEGFREVVDAVVKWFQDEVWPAIQAVAEFIVAEWDKMAQWTREHWDDIKATIETVVNAIRAVVEAVIGLIKRFWDRWGQDILELARTVWDNIKRVISGVMEAVRGIIEAVMGLIRGDWDAAWEGVKKAVAGVWDAIKALVSSAVATLKLVLSMAWDGIKIAAGAAWDGIKAAVSAAVTGIVDTVKGIPGKLIQLGGSLLEAGAHLGKSILNGLKDGLSSTVGFIGDIGRALLNAVKDIVNTQIIDRINSALEFTIPLPFGKSFTIDPPDIQRWHSGGWVGNPSGPPSDIPAILQQGEYVLSRADVAGIRENGGMGAPLLQVGQMVVQSTGEADALASLIAMRVAALS